jgi:2-methylcitrate dehydratase PrpD
MSCGRRIYRRAALLIEGEAEAPFWRDLGDAWEITRHYLKPYPVCRWAQPAMDAAADLISRHHIDPRDIAGIEIRTFDAAVRLGTRAPRTTEEAQYALGFPVAAIAARGALGAAELGDDGLRDPAIAVMLDRIRVVEDLRLTARFPAERLAAVEITLRDGRRFASAPTVARGDPEHALADAEVSAKFRTLADGLPPERRRVIEQGVAALDTDAQALAALTDAVLARL